MKLAVVGSRNITKIAIDEYIPEGVTEIVSGGARGIDSLAAEYARRKGLTLTEFLPDYNSFGRAAPVRRNAEIADYADFGIAFWDGKSKGTEHTINFFRKRGKEIKIIIVE